MLYNQNDKTPSLPQESIAHEVDSPYLKAIAGDFLKI